MDSPNCYCPVCGNGMDVTERELNAERPPLCSEECEREWAEENDTRPLEERWAEWQADINYRCGYDYACGYHD